MRIWGQLYEWFKGAPHLSGAYAASSTIAPSLRARWAISSSVALGALLMWLAPTSLHAAEPPGDPANGFQVRFEAAAPPNWQVAYYAFSHPMFDTDWSRANVAFDKGLHLTLTPQEACENRFSGGSIRHTSLSHYGRYEATIRPAKGDGVVTGFFTYTGPYYGARHDEIDIEFLGQDTTTINLAWFVDGQLHDRKVPLGFDAAERAARYAFEWHPDRLRWFAGDHLLLEVTAEEAPLPQVAGYLFANLWAVDKSLKDWAGEAKAQTTASAFVTDIRFIPLAQMPSAQTGRGNLNAMR
ncbi:family 16 glycosylhydrolase [Shimia sp. R9_3]|uniref:family 16 glycosylhydrolase n=1 Tax=Shimia sp. R9_3 TaxID=2821113 RepID=UPI001ADB7CBE